MPTCPVEMGGSSERNQQHACYVRKHASWRICTTKANGRLEKVGKFTLEIVKQSEHVVGYEVLLRRWVVERTFAWMGRFRRQAKHFD